MISIHGIISREIPDPDHANETPNWFTITGKFPHSFEGENEIDVFKKIRHWQDSAFYGTNNGMVPHFEFNDKTQEQRYYEWLKENPMPVTSYNQTF